MAKIRVFNQANGSWSKTSIKGLDRAFLVEAVITSRFDHSKYKVKNTPKKNGLPDTNVCMKHIEVDFNRIKYNDIIDFRYSFIYSDPDTYNESVRETESYEEAEYYSTELTFSNVNLNPTTLLVGLDNLHTLIKDLKDHSMGYLVPIIEEIIKLGDIPADASKDYSLILKFE